MKTTKDELVALNAKLQEKHNNTISEEKNLKKAISGFLDSYETKYNNKEIKTLEWLEIIFELGKLKERAKRFERLWRLEEKVNYLQESKQDKENYLKN